MCCLGPCSRFLGLIGHGGFSLQMFLGFGRFSFVFMGTVLEAISGFRGMRRNTS